MSTVIDEKVVEMRFDNRDFEKNVATSLTTIEKLKAGLNFEGASKGLEGISDAAGKVNLTGVGNQVDEVKVKFSALQVVASTALATITNKAINGLFNGLNSVASKITGIFDTIKEKGNNRALNIEQAKFQFKGLGMDVEKAMAAANEAVSGTAYGLDEAAMAASMFGASGMQAGDDMAKALRAISGVAAMTGSSYSEIANIFTTVAGNGRLMGDQLLQLSYRGMNVAATMGKAMGKTEAEIRDMVSKGKISFQEFYEAMDEAFGEHAKDANSTFTGAMSNVYAALGRIGEQFMTPLHSALQKVFVAIIPVLNNLKAALKPVVELFTEFSDKLATGVAGVLEKVNFDGLQNGLERIKGGFLNLHKSVTLTDFGVIHQQMMKIADLRNPGKGLQEASSMFKEFNQVLIETARENGVAIDDLIEKNGSLQGSLKEGWLSADIWKQAMDKITGSTKSASKSATADLEAIDKAAKDILSGKYGNGHENRRKAIEELGLEYEQVRGLVNAYCEGTEEEYKQNLKVTSSTEAYSEALRTWAIEASKDGNAVAKMYLEMTKISGAQHAVNAILNVFLGLKAVFSQVSQAFKEVFLSGITDTGIYSTLESIDKLTESFRKNAEESTHWKSIFKGVFSILKAGISVISLVSGAIWKLGSVIIPPIFNIVLRVIGVVGEVISKVVQLADVIGGAIISKISELWNSFKNLEGVKFVIDSINEGFRKFDELIDSVAEWISNLDLSKAKKGFEIFKSVIDKASKAIKNFISNCKPLQSVIGIVGNIFDTIKTKILSFADSINLDGVGNVFGPSGPVAKVFSNIQEFFTGDVLPKFMSLFSSDGPFATAFGMVKDFFTGEVFTTVSGLFDEGGAITKFFELLRKTFIDDNQGEGNIEELVTTVVEDGVSLSEKSSKGMELMMKSFEDISSNEEDLNGFEKFVEKLKKFFEKITEHIDKIANAIALLTAILVGISIYKLNTNMAKMAKDIGGTFGELKKLMKSYRESKYGKSGVEKIADVFKSLAILVGVITVCVLILSKLKPEEFHNGLMNVIKILGTLAVFTALMSVFADALGKESIMLGIAKMFEKLAILLGSIVLCVLILGKSNPSTVSKGLKAMAIILAELAIFMVVLKTTLKAGKYDFGASGNSLIGMSATLKTVGKAIRNIAGTVLVLGRAKPETVRQGLKATAALLLELGVFMNILKSTLTAGKFKIGSSPKALAEMSVLFKQLRKTLVVISIAVLALGKAKAETLKQGIKAVGEILTILAASMVVMTRDLGMIKTASAAKLAQMKTMLMAMAIVVAALAIVVLAMSKNGVQPDYVAKMMGSFSIILIALAAVMKAIGSMKVPSPDKMKTIKKALGTLTLVIVAIGAVMAIMSLTGVTGSNAIGYAVGLSITLAAMTGVFIALTKFGKVTAKQEDSVKRSIKALASLALVCVELAVVFSIMAKTGVDGTQAIEQSIALTIMLGAMTGVLIAINKFAKVTKAGFKNLMLAEVGLAGIAGICAVVGLVFAMMQHFNVDGGAAIKQAEAITVLLVAMTGVLAAVTALSGLVGANPAGVGFAILGLYLISGVVAVLATILLIPFDPNSAMPKVNALAKLLGVMTAVLAAVTVLGFIAQASMVGMGICIAALYLLSGVIAILGAILLIPFNADEGVTKATALTNVLMSMTKVLAVITLLGLIAPAAAIGMAICMAALYLLVGVIALIAVVLDKMDSNGMEAITKATALALLLNTFIDVMAKCALIGLVAPAAIIGIGLLDTFIADVIVVAAALSKLNEESDIWDKAIGVIEKISLVAEKLGEVVGNFIGGIAEGALGKIGSALGTMWTNMQPFIDGVKDVDESFVTSVNSLVAALLKLTAADVLSGILSFFKGGIDFGKLGSNFSELGEAIGQFKMALSNAGVKDSDAALFESASKIMDVMIEMQSKIGRTGGWIQAIVGEEDLDKFGKSLQTFITAMYNSVNKLRLMQPTAMDQSNFEIASQMAQQFVDIANQLPKTGGLWEQIAGEQDLSDFGKKISAFVTEMLIFMNTLRTMSPTKEDVTLMDIFSQIAGKIIELANQLAPSGGLIQEIFGQDGDLGSFGEGLCEFGEAVGAFCDVVAEKFGDGSAVENLNSLIHFLTCLGQLYINKDSADLMSSYSIGLQYIRDQLVNMFQALSEVDIETVTANLQTFMQFFDPNSENSLMGLIQQSVGLGSGKGAKGGGMFTGLVDQIKQAGLDMMQALSTSIKSQSSQILASMTTIMTNMISKIKSQRPQFYTCGQFLMMGLKEGIMSKAKEIAEAAAKVVKDAVDAAKQAGEVHSPSRVFMRIGAFLAQGMIIGLDGERAEASRAGARLITKAIEAAENAVENMDEIVPTITPVMDLSEVQNGLKNIGSMFKNNNVGTISASMENARQASFGSQINPDSNESNNGTTVNFTQNNYSPKALDRIEIYRQTQTQLSSLKGAYS